MTLCARMLKFEGEEPKACGEEATGGLRVVLLPAEAVEKRWGRSSLLTFVMDLPTCPRCVALTSIFDCTSKELRASLVKMAQRMNQGILVDWSRTRIEPVPFDHPEYLLLRKAEAEHAAPQPSTATFLAGLSPESPGQGDAAAPAVTNSQPAPAGPQQGAGHGAS